MTENTGATPPFPGFPGFPPAEMLDKMWDMMRLAPFGGAFPGAQPGTAQGFSPPLSAISDMMAPLMNVEELDKRITDMRAVEQWLKLNLNMLQSAIQGLEVQRATLATLRAFGSFAQAAVAQPSQAAQPTQALKPDTKAPWASAAGSSARAQTDSAADAAAPAHDESAAAVALGAAPFDPSGWWNLLQAQFNQLAQFAMAQPGAAPGAEGVEASDVAEFAKNGEPESPGAPEATPRKTAGDVAPAAGQSAARPAAAKRAAAKPATKAAGGTPGGAK